MLIKFIENLGAKTINAFVSLYEVFVFSVYTLTLILNPFNYNSKIQKSLIIRIYRSSIVIIPQFSAMAFFFGSILIGFVILIATEYNMQVKIGSIIVTFVINEFSSLMAVLFIVFRSHKSPLHTKNKNLLLSRVPSSIISLVSLSILFGVVMIGSGYLFTLFFMGMDLHTYEYLIFNAIGVSNLLILLIKSVVFGFIVAVIPIYSAIRKREKSNNLAKILISVFFIEIFSLLIQKVINAL